MTAFFPFFECLASTRHSFAGSANEQLPTNGPFESASSVILSLVNP